MPDLSQLRSELTDLRRAVTAADADLLAARGRLAEARERTRAARATGEPAALADALDGERQADAAWAAVRFARDSARTALDASIAAAVPGLGLTAGLDRDVPVALLPVRIETRFDSSSLHVRIYPDDVHIDDHESALTEAEVARGRDYWGAVRGGTPEDEAWARLVASSNPYRALWIVEQLRPDAAGNSPDVPLRPNGSSRPTVARGLPDQFVVRVRAGGQVITVVGKPVADVLPVGPDLAQPGDPRPPQQPDDDSTVVLDEDLRWMVDLPAAIEAGMAVTVPLPPLTDVVDDVTVLGTCVSLSPTDSAELLTDLTRRHRVTNGAAFVPRGTPTNNLSDTASGWTSRPDPARLAPQNRPAPGPTSESARLTRALGLAADALTGLTGADDTDDDEAGALQEAVFEATWGAYLRQQARPAIPPRVIPEVYRHVTTHVRAGGPLPTVRLGRQPYGFLPIQPRGWHPAPDDGRFVRWLGPTLARVRAAWLAGFGDAPSGLALYNHEAVSTRVRVRSCTASSSVPSPLLFGIDDEVAWQAQQRRLAAELGLGDTLPLVLRNLYAKDPAELRLPMSVEGDLAFNPWNPEPKKATSVLGLLLRNAALQAMSGAADELLGDTVVSGMAQWSLAPMAQGVAATVVTSTPTVATRALTSPTAKLELLVPGSADTVRDRLDGLVLAPPDATRYLFTDAIRLIFDAVARLETVPVERRARLVGEVLDAASHRYDAWVTSLAMLRLEQLRASRPDGVQLGAWGYVHGVRRRRLTPVAGRQDLPPGIERDGDNKGFVLAPSMRHAAVAGVLRAAWAAHGASPTDATAPFATDLTSRRLRRALDLAAGLRNGQRLGALLGYQLERALHDASGGGVEVDWIVYELRRRHPLVVGAGEVAAVGAERLVCDGWAIAQGELDREPGQPGLADDVCAGRPAGERQALQTALDDLVAALDAVTDLGLAESMYQLAGRNVERAAAAADMVGRAALPPDRFDVTTTPRGSTDVEQRLVMVFSGAVRPAGWAAGTPRARLAPEADAFVAERLGAVDGLVVRVLDANGGEAGSCLLGDLGLAALDVAADAAGTVDSQPFPLLLGRARARAGATDGVALGLDPDLDGALLDLLGHAAAWHRTLAGRPPLGEATFLPRAAAADRAPDAAALAAVAALADELGAAAADDHPLWGLFVPESLAAGTISARRAEVAEASDPVAAATALFGSRAVVLGRCAAPAPVAVALADQGALGVDPGVAGAWLGDTARVREAARDLDDALLHGEVAGRGGVPLRAGQTPALPYAAGVPAAAARQWVGLPFPGPIGREPTVSYLIAGDAGPIPVGPQPIPLTGLELDAWVESVPDRIGTAAVAANLSAPDARAPNVVLLAVPAATEGDWTPEALFSVVDEAIELARCRMVDLDATKRVPQLLPACFINDYDEPQSWSSLLTGMVGTAVRYRAEVTP